MSVLTDSNGNVYVSNGSAITYSGGSGATEPYREDTVELVLAGTYEVTSCTLHGYEVIPAAMFDSYKYLSLVDLSDSTITGIETYAFHDCQHLGSFSIPNTVLAIGANAFEGCIALTSIIIPSSVNTISNEAFKGCGNLSEINIESTAVTFGTDTFLNVYSTGIAYVPTGMVTTYENALRAAGLPNDWTVTDQQST